MKVIRDTTALTVDVSFTDVDVFQDMLNVLIEICEDDRLADSVKEEYKEKLFSLIDEDEYLIEVGD